MNKAVNREAFRAIIPRIWRIAQEVEIIGSNTFVFTFSSPVDRRRVLGGGPWSFDNALLILEEPIGNRDLANMKFERVMFWVQIHNGPLLCMTRDIGTFLGGLIGDVAELDTRLRGECFGKYLRVRVWVDVTKPLKHFLRVRMAANKPEIVMLLNLLSLVGHRDAETTTQYGLWLRATSPTKNRGSKFGGNGPSSSLPVPVPMHAVGTWSRYDLVASPLFTTRSLSPADDGLHDDSVLNHTNMGSLLKKIQPHATCDATVQGSGVVASPMQ
ncbi:hypothetical protein ACOSP7_020784 [Xanthoceras sorbifolium]